MIEANLRLVVSIARPGRPRHPPARPHRGAGRAATPHPDPHHEKLGREPTDDELADALRLPVPRLLRLRDAGQTITSLDAPIGDDGAALQDFLEDDSAVGPDELAIEAIGREVPDQVLAAVPERQRRVLILRSGLDSGIPRTLERVGAVMGVSRERAVWWSAPP